MYKLVVFDLDGTIADTKYGIMDSVKYGLNKLGLKFNEEMLIEFVGPPLYASIARFFPETTREEQDKFIKYFREDYDEKSVYNSKLFEDTLFMLDELKQKKIGMTIATVKPYYLALKVVNHVNIKDYFAFIDGCEKEDAARVSKTDIIKNSIEKYEKKYGHLNKKEICMVGDTKSDGFGANEIGIDFFAVLHDRSKEEFNGLEVKNYVSDFKELIPLISE